MIVKAEDKIMEIIYKNSVDSSEGLMISFEKIPDTIRALIEDKVEFTKFYVAEALKQAAKKAEWDCEDDAVLDGLLVHSHSIFINKNSILNSYDLNNIK